MELTLNKLKGKGPEYIIGITLFRETKMEYLGFWVTHDGVKHIHKKEAIKY